MPLVIERKSEGGGRVRGVGGDRVERQRQRGAIDDEWPWENAILDHVVRRVARVAQI